MSVTLQEYKAANMAANNAAFRQYEEAWKTQGVTQGEANQMMFAQKVNAKAIGELEARLNLQPGEEPNAQGLANNARAKQLLELRESNRMLGGVLDATTQVDPQDPSKRVVTKERSGPLNLSPVPGVAGQAGALSGTGAPLSKNAQGIGGGTLLSAGEQQTFSNLLNKLSSDDKMKTLATGADKGMEMIQSLIKFAALLLTEMNLEKQPANALNAASTAVDSLPGATARLTGDERKQLAGLFSQMAEALGRDAPQQGGAMSYENARNNVIGAVRSDGGLTESELKKLREEGGALDVILKEMDSRKKNGVENSTDAEMRGLADALKTGKDANGNALNLTQLDAKAKALEGALQNDGPSVNIRNPKIDEVGSDINTNNLKFEVMGPPEPPAAGIQNPRMDLEQERNNYRQALVRQQELITGNKIDEKDAVIAGEMDKISRVQDVKELQAKTQDVNALTEEARKSIELAGDRADARGESRGDAKENARVELMREQAEGTLSLDALKEENKALANRVDALQKVQAAETAVQGQTNPGAPNRDEINGRVRDADLNMERGRADADAIRKEAEGRSRLAGDLQSVRETGMDAARLERDANPEKTAQNKVNAVVATIEDGTDKDAAKNAITANQERVAYLDSLEGSLEVYAREKKAFLQKNAPDEAKGFNSDQFVANQMKSAGAPSNADVETKISEVTGETEKMRGDLTKGRRLAAANEVNEDAFKANSKAGNMDAAINAGIAYSENGKSWQALADKVKADMKEYEEKTGQKITVAQADPAANLSPAAAAGTPSPASSMGTPG